MDPRAIWFDSDGTRLFALESGTGEAVILLHGGMADHRACGPFAGPLAARFRVITPDLRASGRSRHAGPLAWDQLADDVAALVRHLDLSRVAVGGISFGSGVALRFALRHPGLAAALLLLTPVYPGADLGLTPAQTAAMCTIAAAAARAPTEGIGVLHPLFDALPAAIGDRARAMVDSFDPGSVAATGRFMASGAQPCATASDLAAVTCRALVIPGSDPEHPRWIAELYARHLRDATLVEVAPAGYADAISAFLGP